MNSVENITPMSKRPEMGRNDRILPVLSLFKDAQMEVDAIYC